MVCAGWPVCHDLLRLHAFLRLKRREAQKRLRNGSHSPIDLGHSLA